MRHGERRWPTVDVVWLVVAFLCGVVSLALVVGVALGRGDSHDRPSGAPRASEASAPEPAGIGHKPPADGR
ncbi:hypothetical protein [Xylanimonas protaetiae]|uniref:Uncharacterized protein n=1 Tax=Xylanimonas protaetiae TaxID=2509457 RepID=A0A4P6F2J4_9MICO|nr:hypothetical protein [Xylanimonas protaetiae]QAY70060.1 hypothetical protein ET471_08450 [Xylanimonas protaetiae]